MNPDIYKPENYPPANIQQLPPENSYPGQQWTLSNEQAANHYPPVPGGVPFYNVSNNPCYQQQPQQYDNSWNNWPASEQNNNAPVYNQAAPTASTLNPQADPWMWSSPGEPQLDYYSDNNLPQQTAPPNTSWNYIDPGYGNPSQPLQPPSQSAWHHPLPPTTDGELWPPQQAAPLAMPEYSSPVEYDPRQELANRLEDCHLTQPEEKSSCDLNNDSFQKPSLEGYNQEVPVGFQNGAIETPLVGCDTVNIGEPSNNHGIQRAPAILVPREGSLFQPPSKEGSPLFPPLTSASTESPILELQHQPEQQPHLYEHPTLNDDSFQDEDFPILEPSPLPISDSTPFINPSPPNVKPESQAEETRPLSDDPPIDNLVSDNLERVLDNYEKPQQEANASRPHPLHLSLHRQHFSSDVDSESRTTLWENPPMGNIPSITLVPFANSPKSESAGALPLVSQDTLNLNLVRTPVPDDFLKEHLKEEPVSPKPHILPSSQNASPVKLPSGQITSPPNPPSPPKHPSPPDTRPTSATHSSASHSTVPSPERKAPTSHAPNIPPQQAKWPEERSTERTMTPLERVRDDRQFTRSPQQGNRQYDRSSTPERLRDEGEYGQSPAHERTREGREYDRSPPPRKHSYTGDPLDTRAFRPGYYPQPPGNYSSRPSSRASEPPADRYNDYYERTSSRMSEAPDERRRRGDYDRGYDNKAFDDPRTKEYDERRDYDRKRYDSRRDYDERPREGEDRRRGEGYDNRQSGREPVYSDRGNRRSARDSDERDGPRERGAREYEDSNRSSYSDKNFSRSRQEEEYYRRPSSQKGYDYYSGWSDPYRMYYQQYYSNYAASQYGSRNNYGYHKELYETDARYRQQVDDYQASLTAYHAQYGYDSDQHSVHSVHSGRSSVNDELRKDRIQMGHDYLDSSSVTDSVGQPTPPPRLTPAKFPCAHPVGRLYPGHILTILPGHTTTLVASINIHDIQQTFQYDQSLQGLKNFPGPLISGQTHKKDVMSFCQQKVNLLQQTRNQVADRSSQILLLELLILLVRQNGNVIGSDIAELLLKDVHNGSSAQTPSSGTHTTGTSPSDLLGDELREGTSHGSSITAGNNNNNPDEGSLDSTPSPDEGIVVSQDRTLINKELSISQVTQKFTEYLLYGNKKDALEWAIRHNLWGHALFLAYRMGSHSHANLMTRFANSLQLNDPLQTLYQLMSGRQPVAVTSVAEEKWGDWRPHLAMILSNPTANPQVDQRSIVTLGDTLCQKGCLSAGHFCYLMAQVELGRFEQKSSKVVLLGANHILPFKEFASDEAIQLTEIYEYAMSLAHSNYMQPNFQIYKFLYATRLAEYGLVREALHYCEVMTTMALQFPNYISLSLFKQLEMLSSRLKYQDPHYTQGTGELEELGDPPWLTRLQQMVQHLSGCSPLALPLAPTHLQPSGQPEPMDHLQDTTQEEQQQPFDYQHPQLQPPQPSEDYGSVPPPSEPVPMLIPTQNNNWSPQHYAYGNNYSFPEAQVSQEGPALLQDPEQLPNQQEFERRGSTTNASFDYYQGMTMQNNFAPQGQGSTGFGIPPQPSRQRQDSVASNSSFGNRKDSNASTTAPSSNVQREDRKAPQPSSKSADLGKPDGGKPQAGRSWLGNIFNRLLPKGPNQMILPDDKTPRIVWDEKTRSWVDLDGNSEDQANANLPPPKDSELMPSMPPGPTSPNSPPSFGDLNRYQRPKQRGMRQNYVDILNSNNNRGSQGSLSAVPDPLFPKMDPHNLATPQLFVPPTLPQADNAQIHQMTNNLDYVPQVENTTSQDSNQPQLLNPADYNMFNQQNVDPARKPTTSRLGGRRAYPS